MLTLRELKYLVRDVLFEGIEQDRQSLIELYPNHESDISQLGSKWIMWLMARFGPSAKLEEVHPFADALVTIKNYSQRDAAISQKYNSSKQWRRAVDTEFPNRKWKNPADVMTMTADDMETLLAMSQRKKQNVDISQVSNVENDRIGKVGPWNLWMPTTKENSCQIAGYDPATMKPYTTWCTARTAGSNLFYNYVTEDDVILFYLIKDDAKKPTDRLSVGFVMGMPQLEGTNGGLSVDGNNKGLTEDSLQMLLDEDYDHIMSILTEAAKKYNNKHPAQIQFAEAAQSVEATQDMLRGLPSDEQKHLAYKIAEKTKSIDVTKYLVDLNHPAITLTIARDYNTPSEILSYIIDREQMQGGFRAYDVIGTILHHHNATTDIYMKLSDSHDGIRFGLANVKACPAIVLDKLASDKLSEIRLKVARHINTSNETLKKLANDSNLEVSSEALQRLAKRNAQ